MQKRKGFTLVELVIVIAVIAILAGVLIGTFASVINRANESARMQELKAQEIEQKAEDILKKIEDSNWYGWEDFEASLVAKMTEAYKKNSTASITEETIQKVVKKALDEFATSQASQHTSLTSEQVKAIVENAIGGINFNGVTEAQVRAIVGTATSSVLANQLTVSQIRTIINAANENNLTANDLAKALASLPSNTTIANLETNVTTKINEIAKQLLTEEQVANVLKALVPTTVTAKDATDAVKLFKDLVSGSTIILGDGVTGNLDFELGDSVSKTIILVNNSATPYEGTITITGARATVYLIGDFKEVVAEKVDTNSLHILGKVNSLTINQGRAVVEGGAEVTNLKAAPAVNATVIVVVEKDAKANTLVTEYQEHGFVDGNRDFILVENNGYVGTTNLTASSELQCSSAHTTTNVEFKNNNPTKRIETSAMVVTDLTKDTTLKVDDASGYVDNTSVVILTSDFAGGDGLTEDTAFLIVDYDTFQKVSEYYDKGYYYFKVKDGIKYIDCKNWVSVNLNGSLEGNNVKIVNLDKPLFGYVDGDNVNISNLDITANISVSDGVAALIGDQCKSLNATIDNVDVHGTIIGASWVVSYVVFGPGPSYSWNLTIKNSLSDLTLVATSGSASGFVGHPYDDVSNGSTNGTSLITIIDSVFTGNMTAKGNVSGNNFKYFTINGNDNRVKTYYSDDFITTLGYNPEGTLYNVPVDKENYPIINSADGSKTFFCGNYGKNVVDNYKPTTKKGTLNTTAQSSLPENIGDVFTVTKLANATKAVVSLLIAPNDSNNYGSYLGTYLSEEIDISAVEAGSTFTSNIVKKYEINVNSDATVKTGISDNIFNVVNPYYGLNAYSSATVTIVQFDTNENVLNVTSIQIAGYHAAE